MVASNIWSGEAGETGVSTGQCVEFVLAVGVVLVPCAVLAEKAVRKKGNTNRLWLLYDVIAKIDESAPAFKVRGPYKKRARHE